ncbi:Dimethyl sulfoxide reductase DmsA [Tepidimonas aquatica]|uniref:Dimethyl sulfoxide reductase DmsA n=2 Tax=Tepidimonas aquatica TaxID=247482 RepID=A0A554WJN9_9BURK|nr:Dimethyl sulfoxide reductase DmsA [Tepidimonas aquatica]
MPRATPAPSWAVYDGRMTHAASTHGTAAAPAHDATVLGACPHDCPDTCSLVTTVRAGRAVYLRGNPDHPQTAGVLCTKVSRYLERVYHPQRLTQPLRRVGPKGAGRFEPVSWDEALDDIAARLRAIAARDPQAIVPYSYAGTMGLVQGEAMAARFFHRLGASLLDRTICSSAGAAALQVTLGGKVGMPVHTFADSRLILIWGSHSIASNLHFWRVAQQAKRCGAKLVCIDPRRTETADKCDLHLALRPGTDAALAYALMHECFVHGWVDHDYLQRHTVGWQALRARALQWPPARAAAVCGLPVAAIEALARELGACFERGEPIGIRLNYGMQRTRGGGNAVRAVACLPAVLGAWRRRGGGLLLSSSGWFPVQRDVLYRPDLLARSPCPQPRTINMSTIGDALLHPGGGSFGPRIEALIVYNSNPAAVAPQSGRVVQGLRRDDLFTVVLEQFQTDTADHADYLLPATTQLEHWDIHLSYGHTDVLLNRPAIAPQGQAWPNTAVFRALARRLGFDEPCFDDDDLTLCRQAFGTAVDFERLLRDGWAPLPVPDVPFADGGFPTPSGKCELFSAALAAQGLDGLPEVLPNHEPAGADPRYPLAMISPPARHFLNSTFVNVKSLRDAEGEPCLEIHPDDAAPRGIADGDTVEVFNDRGRHRTRARVTTRARPGVVVGLGIWWRKDGLDGTNVNELTSQALTDLGRAPTFYDCAVQVRRCAAA